MARKAAHDQRSIPTDYICPNCRKDTCNLCVDVVRYLLGKRDTLCNCKRRGHSGEARDKQILDPENGTVYGPGLRVTQEGEVIRERNA